MADFDYDLFISHASDDKEGFVRDLVNVLVERDLRVWFDEAELQVGDSLVGSIDDGLRRSRFAVVILSRAFFAKRWPRTELDALANREISGGGGVVVLPIWLDVGYDDVAAYSPILANKFAPQSSEGVQAVADQLERRVRGPEAISAPVRSTRLQQSLLRGRILPYTFSPYIQSGDHALSSRVAIAARVPTDPEPTLRPDKQTMFVNALGGSQVESLLQELTMYGRRPRPEHRWELVEPTRTWVLTAARPLARMAAIEGFSAEARAAVNLRYQPTVVPLGQLILTVDVAIRPTYELQPDVMEPIPLSLDDLFALVYVPLTAVLDEIAPAVLPAIGGAVDILSVGCLLMPHGDLFSRYVRFDRYAGPRISGASDPHAIDWYPASYDEIATPEARTAAVRERIEGLFIDGGYRDYDAELQRLAPPRFEPHE